MYLYFFLTILASFSLFHTYYALQIDNSVVESFGEQGKTCITSRVYPARAIGNGAHLFAFNNGTEPIVIETLNAWTMNSPKYMNQ